jgi:hypothetical protein
VKGAAATRHRDGGRMISGCHACGQFPNQALALPVSVRSQDVTVKVMPKFSVRSSTQPKFSPNVKRLPKV